MSEYRQFRHRESEDKRKRKRSRSPFHDLSHTSECHKSHPQTRHRLSHHHHGHLSAKLPFDAPTLDKRDLKRFRTLFGQYLDVQKSLDIDDLSDHEVRGRWKSFLKKWNCGELAQGWYDPDRVTLSAPASGHLFPLGRRFTSSGLDDSADVKEFTKAREENGHGDEDQEVEDEIGPTLPLTATTSAGRQLPGPSIPNLSDLQHVRELANDDRTAHFSNIRQERKQDRKLQKERLEEMAPRADPGSRERQLEKRRDAAASNRAFRDSKDSGDVDVDDGDLMGDDAGEDAFKKRLKETQRKKTEREIRKEEVLRAKQAEREERLLAHREKEERILAGFRELVKAKFG